MLHSPLNRAALGAALLTCLVLAPAASADAAKRTDWRYDVTVRAEMTETWSFHEEAHLGDDVEPCDRYQDGAGTARIQLRSRRPTRVMVLRAGAKALPNLDVGTGEGISLTGSYLRDGRDETRHEGPRCGPGNPPFAQPVTGCGRRDLSADWTLLYSAPGTVAPQMIFDDLRQDCPAGPSHPVEWDGDVVPHLTAAVTKVPPSKFYGTKQFTVRGSRTFRGIVPTISEPHFARRGQHEVRWAWETTYRLVSEQRKVRRR